MPEAREGRVDPAGFRIPVLGLLWFALAAAYLAASASGHRAVALAAAGLMAGALVAASGRQVAGLLTGLALAGACLYWSDAIAFVVYAPPLAAFAFMAYFFHRTLGRGVEPLITRVARAVTPDLPVEVAHYTRALTRIWSCCFATLFLAAGLSAPVLTLEAWSRWVQGLGLLVPAALFLIEYAYRRHRFPDRAHGSFPAMIVKIAAVFRQAAVKPAVHGAENYERR